MVPLLYGAEIHDVGISIDLLTYLDSVTGALMDARIWVATLEELAILKAEARVDTCVRDQGCCLETQGVLG